ncbi:MAG: hypothetical protein B6229_10765 [Spirochaetaceae bacterium 4572_7]|nr:MAG: hypothetical protein B6229_10765 [Spirochaetaceae bacterium 4572_7]
MKKLPTGIQTFSTIREGNYIYIDKTEDIYNLIDRGTYYFLSRPRRFGKSLLIDTISELFKGSKEYFEGLFIYDKWDWKTKYPIIKINFGGGDYSTSETLKHRIDLIIEDNCDELSLNNIKHNDFLRLIKSVYKKYGQKVVILVDEYDKPIIDVITNKEIAEENRNILSNLYSAIKTSDQYVKFAMLTGVSKFSKVNLFSNLNNLTDITTNRKYGTITGYTQNDLETHFSEHLNGVDMEEVKRWYNGYNYFAEPIYNPFDILQFIENSCIFKNYWWETGNPRFLIEILKKSNFYLPTLENLIVEDETLNAFDVEKIDLVALLWQTGYLTFDKEIVRNNKITYKMKIPNVEVKNSLYALFFDYLVENSVNRTLNESRIQDAIDSRDLLGIKEELESLFSSIAYNNYTKNNLVAYEGYYASIIFSFLFSLGYDIIAEDVTNRGRIDLTLKTKDAIFILEYKVNTHENAIKQIKERKYYEKYLNENKEIFMIGINFDSELKNISNYQWEQLLF